MSMTNVHLGGMPAAPGQNPGVAYDPNLIQTGSQANASLNGIPLRLNPNSVTLPYSIKMRQDQTVGGMVIQVYGVSWGDLVVSGQIGAGGWQEQQQFYQRIKGIATASANTQMKQMPPGQVNPNSGSVRFFFPLLNYDFQVFLKSFTNPDGQGSVVIDNKIINPQYTLTFTIDNDNNGLAKTVADSYISRLAAGIGYTPNDYNGPMQGDAASSVDAYVQKYAPGMDLGTLIAQTFGVSPADAAQASSSVGGTSAGAGASTTALNGNSNEEKCFNFFTANGYSKVAAAALVGNMMQESGCSPTADEGHVSGQGQGIVQWSLTDRWTTCCQFSGVKGVPRAGDAGAPSLSQQLAFCLHELSGSYSSVGQYLRGITSTADLDAATVYVMKNYEGPAEDTGNARYNFAQQAINQYGGGGS